MTTSVTSSVYLNVIDDVINKVRDDFVSEDGPGDVVLTMLQQLWEMKLIQTGCIVGPIDRPPPVPGAEVPPVHDLNVPYEELQTPTAEMLFPPTPLQTPGTVDSSMYNIPTGPTDYPTPTSNDGSTGPNDLKPVFGRPSSYMQPPSPWMNPRPSMGVDVNVAYVEGGDESGRGTSQPSMQDFLAGSSGKRKHDDVSSQYQTGGFIPQQDGSGDVAFDVFELEIIQSKCSGRTNSLKVTSEKVPSAQRRDFSRIPQLDGPIPDPYDDMLSTPTIHNYHQGIVNEDYNVVNTPAPNDLQAGTPAIPAPDDIPDEDDDDEPPLNENDDDDLDDVDQGEELNTQHLVLAQFDKVSRTKSRWKCSLKDGIMHINNKDILFNKATGEFDF